MKWHLESWRKLYRTCPPSWLRLSVSARGLGSELLKYADDDGLIAIGDDDPGVAVAFMLGARPREHKRIREDVAELLKDGYLCVEESSLRIKNFVEAQDRTPGAKRTADWRARKSSPETSQSASHVTSRETLQETSHERACETSIRHDPIRHETIRSDPPVGPPRPPEPTEARDSPQAAPTELNADSGSNGPKQRAIPPELLDANMPKPGKTSPGKPSRKKPASAAPGSDENPFEVGEWLTRWKIPRLTDEREGTEVAKFLDYHRAKGSLWADWTAAWRTWQRNAVEFAKGRGGGAYRPVQPPAPQSQSMSLEEWYAKNPPSNDPDECPI